VLILRRIGADPPKGPLRSFKDRMPCPEGIGTACSEDRRRPFEGVLRCLRVSTPIPQRIEVHPVKHQLRSSKDAIFCPSGIEADPLSILFDPLGIDFNPLICLHRYSRDFRPTPPPTSHAGFLKLHLLWRRPAGLSIRSHLYLILILALTIRYPAMF